MRYHWGLGVGHRYAYQPTSTFRCDSESEDEMVLDLDLDKGSGGEKQVQDADSDNYDSDHPEFALEDREVEGWTDEESDHSASGSDGSYSEGDDCDDMEDAASD